MALVMEGLRGCVSCWFWRPCWLLFILACGVLGGVAGTPCLVLQTSPGNPYNNQCHAQASVAACTSCGRLVGWRASSDRHSFGGHVLLVPKRIGTVCAMINGNHMLERAPIRLLLMSWFCCLGVAV